MNHFIAEKITMKIKIKLICPFTATDKFYANCDCNSVP